MSWKKNIYHDRNVHSTCCPINTEGILITWLLFTRQFWSHEYRVSGSSDHMTTVSQAVLITWLLSASFDHMNTVSQADLITWLLSTCSFDHMNTDSQEVLITWLLSARQFLSHDYCRPGNFYHMTTVRQFWSHEYCICWSGSHVPKIFFFSQEIFRQIIQYYFQCS